MSDQDPNDGEDVQVAKTDYKGEKVIKKISIESSTRPDRFMKRHIPKPERIGFYSINVNLENGSRIYSIDKSRLRYLDLLPEEEIDYDLAAGYDSTVNWTKSPLGKLDILRWILEHNDDDDDDSDSDSTVKPNFVAYARLLAAIMMTPYETFNDWMMIAVKVRGTIYLKEIVTDSKKDSEARQNDFHNKSSYCGYKFEEYVTKHFDGPTRPATNEGLRDSFHCILRSKIGRHSILYTSRMDALVDKSQIEKPLNEMEFVEVKSRGTLKKPHVRHNFWNRRVIRWWAKALLSAVDTTIVGHRGDDFHVRHISRLKTSFIPSQKHDWCPKVCIDFLEDFLNILEDTVTEELKPYRVYCKPLKEIVFTDCPEPVENFIPRWFIDGQLPVN